MKYITPELLQQANNGNEIIDKKIEEKYLEYENYYNMNRKKFSDEFLNIYENNYRFHDWNLESISYFPSENQKNDIVELKISHINTVCVLKFYGVNSFSVDMDYSKTKPLNMPEKDICYIDEWEFMHKKFKYKLLTLGFTLIKISCSKVTVRCCEL